MRISLVCLSLLAAAACRAQTPISVEVDASHVTQCINHVHETMPISPGALTLYYPKWMPGGHSPSGPINSVINLHFRAGDREIPWRRDDVDMFTLHLDAPNGASSLTIDFDEAFAPDRTSTANLARISFFRDVFYPAGPPSDDIPVTARLRLPEGWKFGTALPIDRENGRDVLFKTASLTTVVDSPVVAGRYYTTVVLAENPTVELDIVGDTPQSIQLKPETVAKLKKMVAEQYAQFGAHHYRDYHFLLTFSDHGAGAGLEHHECSEDGIGLNGASDEKELGYLLCHEYTHSWNGKYRRPAGLATPDYEAPMKGELLWVYEGLTEYIGTKLSVRAGLWSPETYREALAAMASQLGSQEGRTWRPLVDTAVGAQLLYGPHSWYSATRGVDYYYEGVMIWLEADCRIRELTNGQKSLDDFFHIFHGPPSTDPMVKPYTFDDVVSALNQVAPYDWAGFLRKRVYDLAPNPPVGGIEEAGWRLVYNDQPNERAQKQYEREGIGPGLRYSVGMLVGTDGTIADVIPGMPAFKAGLGIGMKCVGVNGHAYSDETMETALRDRRPIQLTTSYAGEVGTYTIEYTGGVRWPHLDRLSSKPDLLEAILAPRT